MTHCPHCGGHLRRRTYRDEDLRAKALEMYKTQRAKVVAHALGVSANTVYLWARQERERNAAL